MSASSQPQIHKHQHKNSLSGKALINIVYLILIAFFIIVISIPIVYLLASKRVHRHNMNLLYDVFENSTQHAQLYQNLSKSKYALIYGEKQGALFSFMDHFANKQTLKERNVIVQDFHTATSTYSEWIEEIQYLIEQALDLEDKFKNIWILQSRTGQNIPKTAILKILHRHPKDKIYIVITRKQKLPSFEVFEYPSITEHDVVQSIEQNFGMDESTADILYDFFGSPQIALEALDIGHYSQEELLGENYREMIEFSQQDIRILKDLCKKGEAKVNKISDQLIQFGLVNHQGNTYWVDRYFMLNYELHKKIRCSDDGVATEEILFQIQQNLESHQVKKTAEDLIQEEAWNEDEIVKIQVKPKKKKSKKSKLLN